MSNEANEVQFVIQRVYMKGLSFEAPNTPAVFQQEWKPELNIEMNTKHNDLGNNIYEVALRITATVKNQNAIAFLVEIEQAGIFTIQGAPAEQMDHILGSYCPNIIYPYAREAITTEISRASFPQLVLAPLNFDALYAQQQQEKQNAAAKVDETETH